MLPHRIVDLAAYILWLSSVVLYNLALWGPHPVGIDGVYVMRLWAQGPPSIALDVGFFGVCAFVEGSDTDSDSDGESRTGPPATGPEDVTRRTPDQGPVNGTVDDLELDLGDATKYCVADLDFSLDPEDLYLRFVDEANMPRRFEGNDTASAAARDLFQAAAEYRTDAFPRVDPVVAMALLVVAAFTLLFPIFFNHPKRRKVCAILLGLSALLLGFGLLGAGGTFFTTWRLRKIVQRFEADGFRPQGVSRLAVGDRLWVFLSAALGTNAVFVVLMTLSALVRSLNARKAAYKPVAKPNGGGGKVQAAETGKLLGGLKAPRFKFKPSSNRRR